MEDGYPYTCPKVEDGPVVEDTAGHALAGLQHTKLSENVSSKKLSFAADHAAKGMIMTAEQDHEGARAGADKDHEGASGGPGLVEWAGADNPELSVQNAEGTPLLDTREEGATSTAVKNLHAANSHEHAVPIVRDTSPRGSTVWISGLQVWFIPEIEFDRLDPEGHLFREHVLPAASAETKLGTGGGDSSEEHLPAQTTAPASAARWSGEREWEQHRRPSLQKEHLIPPGTTCAHRPSDNKGKRKNPEGHLFREHVLVASDETKSGTEGGDSSEEHLPAQTTGPASAVRRSGKREWEQHRRPSLQKEHLIPPGTICAHRPSGDGTKRKNDHFGGGTQAKKRRLESSMPVEKLRSKSSIHRTRAEKLQFRALTEVARMIKCVTSTTTFIPPAPFAYKSRRQENHLAARA